MRCFAALSVLGIIAASLSCSPHGSTTSPAPVDAPELRLAALSELDAREQLIADAIAAARDSAVALEYSAAGASAGTRRVATGVVIDADGEVLSIRIDRPTAARPIMGRDASGFRMPVQWVAADRETGLTLLRIPADRARPGRAATHRPALGSEVLIIGNPFGLGHSVGRGSVSGLNRRLELTRGPLGGLIQIDAPLHPGDSGALVVDLRGEWLGLVRSGLATPDGDHANDHDLGFALSAEDALWVASQLRSRGRVDRAYLGVRLDPGRAGDPPGAVLDDVLDHTPAAQSGLRSGDRVVTFDGHLIRNPRDLTDRLDRTPADADAVIELDRDGQRNRLTIHTAQRPPREDAPTRPKTAKVDEPPPLPREVAKRIERLERRIRELEKSSPPPTSSAER